MSTYYNSTHYRVMHKRQKLTAKDWDIIRQLMADGVDVMQLALAFEVTASYLRDRTR